jgi:hypothetical protein
LVRFATNSAVLGRIGAVAREQQRMFCARLFVTCDAKLKMVRGNELTLYAWSIQAFGLILAAGR